ncbi:MAG: MaoC family dehydratase [Pseudomonadota bacterium]
MTRAALGPGQHGADALSVGDWIDCGTIAATPERILAFAEMTGDRFEIHMSDTAAKSHGFERQVAHGLLVLSLVDGLKNQAPAQFRARASKGWDWTFRAPVLAGDILSVTLKVEDIQSARKQDQATLVLRFEVRNQEGTLVQEGVNRLLAYR